MTDTKKPTLSEIRALRAQAIYTNQDFTQLVHTDIPYLFDLVARMEKALLWSLRELGDEMGFAEDDPVPIHDCPSPDDPENKCTFHDGFTEARALLEELKNDPGKSTG